MYSFKLSWEIFPQREPFLIHYVHILSIATNDFIMWHFKHLVISDSFHSKDTDTRIELSMSYLSSSNPPHFMFQFMHFVILDSFSQHGQLTLSISFYLYPFIFLATLSWFSQRDQRDINQPFVYFLHHYHVPHNHVPTHIFCHNRFFFHIIANHICCHLSANMQGPTMKWPLSPSYSYVPMLHQSPRLWLINQLSMTNNAQDIMSWNHSSFVLCMKFSSP